MKLLGRTEGTITGDRNGKNVSNSAITEVALVHYNIVSNYYQYDLNADICS